MIERGLDMGESAKVGMAASPPYPQKLHRAKKSEGEQKKNSVKGED